MRDLVADHRPDPSHQDEGEDDSRTMSFLLASGVRTEALELRPLTVDAASFESVEPTMPEAFGRYLVRRELGRGGFGRVYVGWDDRLEREVAIKVPLRALTPQDEKIFLLEAKRLAGLKHPGVVTVYDVGVQDGRCFIVSDLVQGISLHEWLRHRQPTHEQ